MTPFWYTLVMKLLLGTNNKGKVVEIAEVLSGLELDLVTPRHLNIEEPPKESGMSFAQNALQKARYFYVHSGGIPTVADDSGIIVEALENELGLHTRRWGAGPTASDEEWIAYFLKRMEKESNKRAAFVCTLAHIDARGQIHFFEGRCEGEITPTLEAAYLPGLPISACFKPDGSSYVFSALPIEQKNSTSHRGQATRKLRQYLEKDTGE